MQVPQWAGPIPMGRRGGPGPSAMPRGWGQCPDYFLGPGIPVLIFLINNNLVIDAIAVM